MPLYLVSVFLSLLSFMSSACHLILLVQVRCGKCSELVTRSASYESYRLFSAAALALRAQPVKKLGHILGDNGVE
jgi:hypothetical protein